MSLSSPKLIKGVILISLAFAGFTAAKADLIDDWNNAAITAIRATPSHSNPGAATRDFAMLNVAIHDAVQSISHTAESYTGISATNPGASKTAAAAQAAHDVLVYLFPAHQITFDSILTAHLAPVNTVTGRAAGVTAGRDVASVIIALRTGDGSDYSSNYSGPGGVGHWLPDPLHPNQKAWGPDWGQVTPWILESSSVFRSIPPPALTSQEYADAVNQVKEYGGLNSTSRTPDQTEIGIFWGYDRATLGPPPVFFNQIMQAVANQNRTPFEEKARLFALGSAAMADASISCWETKYVYDLWRPIGAVRGADLDGNPLTIGDPNWVPLGAPGPNGDNFTPPFPAYVSGHATMGSAVFDTLRRFYHTDSIQIDLESDELPDVVRHYNSFTQMEHENGISRIYLGIHFSFDAEQGYVMGRKVAERVSTTSLRLLSSPLIHGWNGPKVVYEGTTLDAGFACDNVVNSWLMQGILPPGVTFNQITGKVRGQASKAGTYVFNVCGANNHGTGVWNQTTLRVLPKSVGAAGAAGAYAGLVGRLEGDYPGFGGALAINVTNQGGVTGSIDIGIKRYSFKGQVDSTAPTHPRSSILFNSGHGKLDLTWDPASNSVAGTIYDTGGQWALNVEARRKVVSTTAWVPTEWKGDHAVVLQTPKSINPAIPSTDGSGNIRILSTGAYQWVGKLPTGVAYTMSGALNSDGTFAARSLIYKSTGSIQGWQDVSSGKALGELEFWKLATNTNPLPLGIPLHKLAVVQP